MDIPTDTSFATRFAQVVATHRGPKFLEGDTLAALTLHAGGDLSVVWAPFDHVAPTARLAIVGITPGRQQAENALSAFQAALMAGLSPVEALRRAKLAGSFSGPMRSNLVAMLDHIRVNRILGVASCDELFDARTERAHFTSVLRHPVFVGGANYNGNPDMLRTPILRRMIDEHLAAEAKTLPHALWLPLGPKPCAALKHLASRGILDHDRILDGMPHPSGANGERIAYFLGRKARSLLSKKVLPDAIENSREQLQAQIARLGAIA